MAICLLGNSRDLEAIFLEIEEIPRFGISEPPKLRILRLNKMDKFEEKLSELEGMSGEDKNSVIEQMQKDCICPICPTYNECAKENNELLFCVLGKSEECIEKEMGCMCPTCPFAQEYGIGVKYNFYCTRNTELEQREM